MKLSHARGLHIRLGSVLAMHSNTICQCVKMQGCILVTAVLCTEMIDICMGKLSLLLPSEMDDLGR